MSQKGKHLYANLSEDKTNHGKITLVAKVDYASMVVAGRISEDITTVFGAVVYSFVVLAKADDSCHTGEVNIFYNEDSWNDVDSNSHSFSV